MQGLNRKMRRLYFVKKQHHNVYTKKYHSKRSRHRQCEALAFTRKGDKEDENK